MLTLLRNIRRSFLNAGATRKYILYGIGEFILIVAGILVAMQINNWNEGRKEKIEDIRARVKYISDLHLDLKQTELTLEQALQTLNSHFSSSSRVVEVIESGEANHSHLVEMSNIIPSTFGGINPKRYPQTFDRLIDQGDQEILRDDAMLNLLTQFYTDYDELLTLFGDLPQEFRSNWRKYNITNGDLESATDEPLSPIKLNEVKQILRSEEAYNLLLGLVATSSNFLAYFQNIKNRAESIISYMEENYVDILDEE